jgi:hypothetical protein
MKRRVMLVMIVALLIIGGLTSAKAAEVIFSSGNVALTTGQNYAASINIGETQYVNLYLTSTGSPVTLTTVVNNVTTTSTIDFTKVQGTYLTIVTSSSIGTIDMLNVSVTAATGTTINLTLE